MKDPIQQIIENANKRFNSLQSVDLALTNDILDDSCDSLKDIQNLLKLVRRYEKENTKEFNEQCKLEIWEE